MNMTIILLALIAWLLISCGIAWGIGRATDLGRETDESTNPRHESRNTSDRRNQNDRRCIIRRASKEDRRSIPRKLDCEYVVS